MNHVNALGIMEYLQLQIHDFLELKQGLYLQQFFGQEKLTLLKDTCPPNVIP